MARAGFRFEPQAVSLPESATSAGEQEQAADSALNRVVTEMAQAQANLVPFMEALARRVTLALRLAPNSSIPDGTKELADLAKLQRQISKEMSGIHELASKLPAFVSLVRNCGNHPDPGAVENEMSTLATEMQAMTERMQEHLQAFAYPFPHPRSPLTVAEFARPEKAADNRWEKAFAESETHLERLCALNYRLIGRLLALAAAAEIKLDEAECNAPREDRVTPNP
jgi:hypothetical protein